MEPHSYLTITTLLTIFLCAVVGGLFAHKVKIPLVLGYIVVGMVAGNVFPQFFDKEFLSLVSDVGVTLLLFTLGVELSFHRLRHVLGVVFWAAFFQIVLVTSLLFVVFFGILGMPFIPALFVSIAGSLSSTAIIIKILFERGDLDSVPGELMTGWLVVQDISVIPIMVLVPVLVSVYVGGQATVGSTVTAIALQLVKAGLAIGLVLYLGKHGVPTVLNKIATIGSREVFLITTVAIVFAAALTAYAFGLSAGLGAFIAGLLIAETSQNHMVFSEVRPLRDVFATVFFVSMGMSISLAALLYVWPLFIGSIILIVLVKFFIVFFLTRFLGYHQKTGWLVGLGLIPMSEFGFILAKEGMNLGVLSTQDFTFIIALVVGTIAVSSPLLLHAHELYYSVKHVLGSKKFPFGKRMPTRVERSEELPFSDHVVICGYGRVGKYIGRVLELTGIPFVVVDYNHTTITTAKNKGMAVVYGDPADRDVLDKAQVDLAKIIIIAIPDRHTQELIIGHALTLNKSIHIICRTHHEEDQAYLKSLGVHVVVQPEFEASLAIIHRIMPGYGLAEDILAGKLSRLKIEHGLG